MSLHERECAPGHEMRMLDEIVNESKDAPSSDRRILGGIGGSRKGDESGRSMVEALGVLAIMGVLAIGGIAGYRYAIDKYNANEIINDVKKRAVVISQQLAVGGNCMDCSTVDIAALKYKAQCESCGGTWVGAWNEGTCSP